MSTRDIPAAEPAAGNSPETRRREALPRRPVFTVALAGAEIRRRFRARLRLWFALSVLVGLAPAWLLPLLPAEQGLAGQAPVLLTAGALLALSFAARRRLPRVQLASHLLGLAALGAWVGLGAPRDAALAYLLHPTLLVGLPLLGAACLPGLVRRDLPGWAEFLLSGLWLALAGLLLAWLPAGEGILAASGAAGILLLFVVQLASQEALPVYTPAEAGRAAADSLPLALLGLGRRLSGQA
ncbi:MAG TPA: hypothetical protein PK668_07530 [Myxococcota bacterium]|nr:hypothetical protein [Myxococcota bacterium]HRY92304.1 hypothetical protein [Myxococcota bacterium]HSA23743.1 hypothetical protein [Myxococcota bacterium]